MFTETLFEFQNNHETKLLEACKDYKELVLSAPTGTGKTVLACKFIEDYLEENANTVFIWLCPGAGGLESQSQEVFENVTVGTYSGDVYDFIGTQDPRGGVFFVNWDKINKKSNVVLREGERQNLMERVAACHRNGVEIFMLIDEEHKYRETAESFQIEMQPTHILRMSATPLSDGDYKEVISDDEAIQAGLISLGISVNEGVSAAIEENNTLDDDMLLLELADDKRIEIGNKYRELGINIKPLVLIQFPNGNDEWIDRVERKLQEMGYSEENGLLAKWFSGKHPSNPEEIKKNDGQYAFLMFKQALATGWDCPRAKILVKLREGSTEAFNIQTIGRIRRMPERKHYGEDLLDYCYLFTLDNKFKEGLANSINSSFYTYEYRLKENVENILLKKQRLNGEDRFVVNEQDVVLAIRAKMLEEMDLNQDNRLDQNELRAKGYKLGSILKAESFEGIARTTSDMTSLNVIFAGQHEIDLHSDGFIIRDAKRRIARAIGTEEQAVNKALKILFGPMARNQQLSLLSEEEYTFEEENKLIEGLTLKEYNAFLVNNRDKLIDVFSRTNAEEIADIEEADIIESDWTLPNKQYYKHHKIIPSSAILEKNVFQGYGNNILIKPNRSNSEITFEKWCEIEPSVEWVYKNGDKGDEYFCLVCKKKFARSHFYPDYIIKLKNGQTWIIETKGGEDASGKSENVDTYAKNKFEALKLYAQNYPEIKWGFVRNIGQQLYLSNTEWTEEMMQNRNHWKPIEVFIHED